MPHRQRNQFRHSSRRSRVYFFPSLTAFPGGHGCLSGARVSVCTLFVQRTMNMWPATIDWRSCGANPDSVVPLALSSLRDHSTRLAAVPDCRWNSAARRLRGTHCPCPDVFQIHEQPACWTARSVDLRLEPVEVFDPRPGRVCRAEVPMQVHGEAGPCIRPLPSA